jgi:hypothetical protein
MVGPVNLWIDALISLITTRKRVGHQGSNPCICICGFTWQLACIGTSHLPNIYERVANSNEAAAPWIIWSSSKPYHTGHPRQVKPQTVLIKRNSTCYTVRTRLFLSLRHKTFSSTDDQINLTRTRLFLRNLTVQTDDQTWQGPADTFSETKQFNDQTWHEPADCLGNKLKEFNDDQTTRLKS